MFLPATAPPNTNQNPNDAFLNHGALRSNLLIY
jgi:hypothetical protein